MEGDLGIGHEYISWYLLASAPGRERNKVRGNAPPKRGHHDQDHEYFGNRGHRGDGIDCLCASGWLRAAKSSPYPYHVGEFVDYYNYGYVYDTCAFDYVPGKNVKFRPKRSSSTSMDIRCITPS